jgi:hypothetical protein
MYFKPGIHNKLKNKISNIHAQEASNYIKYRVKAISYNKTMINKQIY